MTTQFYRHTASEGKPIGLYGPQRSDWYRVDGQRADPPADSIEVELIRIPFPADLTSDQKAVPNQECDTEAKTFTYGWTLTDKSDAELRAALPSLDNAQMQAALFKAGALEEVRAFVNNLPEANGIRTLAQIRFKSQPTFTRDGPLVEAIRLHLRWSPEQTDEFFRTGSRL